MQLLQQVRNESHRFAVTFQRSKRKVKVTQSWLDAVPGVGEATKMKLIRAFKSPLKVREANADELAAAAGKAAARRITEWLQQQETGEGTGAREDDAPGFRAEADASPADQ